MMSSFDMYRALQSLKDEGVIASYAIHARGKVKNFDDPAAHPLSAPFDQHAYDPEIHPKKPRWIKFKPSIFRELAAVVLVNGSSTRRVLRKLGVHETLYESG